MTLVQSRFPSNKGQVGYLSYQGTIKITFREPIINSLKHFKMKSQRLISKDTDSQTPVLRSTGSFSNDFSDLYSIGWRFPMVGFLKLDICLYLGACLYSLAILKIFHNFIIHLPNDNCYKFSMIMMYTSYIILNTCYCTEKCLLF